LGELPGGVPEKHGWRWRDYEESDGQYQKTLWVARSLPDADGAVRLGCIADGGPAHVGPEVSESAPPQTKPSGPTPVVSALDLKDEAVEIANAGDAPLDLASCATTARASRTSSPRRRSSRRGASVRVRSGPAASKPGAGELTWKTAKVWNDREGTASLEDPAGVVVSSKKGRSPRSTQPLRR
jgi:hypothetical protein